MKLKKEEHEQLKALIQGIRTVESAVAQLSLRHKEALETLSNQVNALNGLKDSFRETYGDVEIDVESGEIKENEETKK